jgi:hypothetical protein
MVFRLVLGRFLQSYGMYRKLFVIKNNDLYVFKAKNPTNCINCRHLQMADTVIEPCFSALATYCAFWLKPNILLISNILHLKMEAIDTVSKIFTP